MVRVPPPSFRHRGGGLDRPRRKGVGWEAPLPCRGGWAGPPPVSVPLALGLSLFVGLLALGGCASTAPPPGPVVSPTGVVLEPGTPPIRTRWSQTATLYLRTGESERAVELALEGVAEDPGNPVHHFLAGVALARIGRYEEADRRLREAERLHPPYALEVEPERQAAWAEAFNRGSEAWGEGDVEGAIAAWKGAARMYRLRPEAHRNLALALIQEGRLEEAAEVYREALDGLKEPSLIRVPDAAEAEERELQRIRMEESLAGLLLAMERFEQAEPLLRDRAARDPDNPAVLQNLAAALAGQGKRAEAGAVYDRLLAGGRLSQAELVEVGVALFREGDPGRAAEAFRRVAEAHPASRDPWFNYVNALFAAERWEELRPASERLAALDPLNETVALIAARALLEGGDEEGAILRVRAIDDAPVLLEGVTLIQEDGGTRLAGRLRGKGGAPGDSITLRFTFPGDTREPEDAVVTLAIPAPGEIRAFTVPAPPGSTGWSYRPETSPPPTAPPRQEPA